MSKLLETLKNPEEAALYLSASLQEEDPRAFLMALRDVADAHGGIRSLSQDTSLNRESLYRMLSRSGNPSLESLTAVLRAVGLRLCVESHKPKRRPGRAA
jgi:probable addiction module antidote protein